MSSGQAPDQRVERDAGDDAPGVSRFDLICGPRVRETSEQLVRRWGQDRGLRPKALDRLCLLASTAVGHGLLYRPRAVTLTMRWADLDRVRVEFRWHGSTGVAPSTVSTQKLESTLAILDALAESWGFGRGSWHTQWMVVDSRT